MTMGWGRVVLWHRLQPVGCPDFSPGYRLGGNTEARRRDFNTEKSRDWMRKAEMGNTECAEA